MIKFAVFLFTVLFFNNFSFLSFSFAKQIQTKNGTLNVKPVNNSQIAIPVFPENNPNNYRSLASDNIEHGYRAQPGHIRDQFILERYSAEYINSLPHGTSHRLTRKEIQEFRKKQMKESVDSFNEYFVMRKRIAAETLRK